VYFNDPELINTVQDKQNAVTLEQTNATIKKYLVRNQRTLITTLPALPDAAGPAKQAH
jgi:predicted Zn-dependent peptidase